MGSEDGELLGFMSYIYSFAPDRFRIFRKQIKNLTKMRVVGGQNRCVGAGYGFFRDIGGSGYARRAPICD